MVEWRFFCETGSFINTGVNAVLSRGMRNIFEYEMKFLGRNGCASVATAASNLPVCGCMLPLVWYCRHHKQGHATATVLLPTRRIYKLYCSTASVLHMAKHSTHVMAFIDYGPQSL